MAIVMTRIDAPGWAPSYARHVVSVQGDAGSRAREIAARYRQAILDELDRRVNAFANDPDQCFLDEASGFPVAERLAGEYYIGSEEYAGEAPDDLLLSIQVRCLEKLSRPKQAREGYDYLGLEAIVVLDPGGDGFEFDEGFNTSAI